MDGGGGPGAGGTRKSGGQVHANRKLFDISFQTADHSIFFSQFRQLTHLI
jgi:hypothetical protein